MATNLKIQKRLETEIHQQLYTNILVLTLEYETTKEFKECFKRDMFVKNNKTAFHQIAHFLISILSPGLFESKWLWPILDNKTEVKFRTELMKYLTDLNSANKETGIPIIMTSHLISPGGYKFAEFMFKLSQYVLATHARKKLVNDFVLFPPRAESDVKLATEQIKNLAKIVDDQYNELALKQLEFDAKYAGAQQRSAHISEQFRVVKEATKNVEIELDQFVQSTEVNLASPVPETYQLDKFKTIEDVNAILYQCYQFTIALNSNGTVPRFTANSMNLLDYLKSHQMLIKTNKHLLKGRKEYDLSDYVQLCNQILDELITNANKSEQLVTELKDHVTKLNQFVTDFNYDYKKNDTVCEKVHEIFNDNSDINISKI